MSEAGGELERSWPKEGGIVHTLCLIGSCYRLSDRAFDCLHLWVLGVPVPAVSGGDWVAPVSLLVFDQNTHIEMLCKDAGCTEPCEIQKWGCAPGLRGS